MEKSLLISWVRCWEQWVRIRPRPKSRNAAFIRIQVTILQFEFHFLRNYYCYLNHSDFCSLLCFDRPWLIYWGLLYRQETHFLDFYRSVIFCYIFADKRISFDQVLPILATLSKNRETPVIEDFIEGFRVFDKDQNGTIHSAELRHLLTHLG